MHSFLNLNDTLSLHLLENDFLKFTSQKKIYDQVRCLDTSGMEIVRVNFNNGKPMIVPREQLQNKKNRYYFRDAIGLGKDEVFISPFDLNIEQGQIEHPQKPMIRFAIPVFSASGNKVGVVILNYLGSHLLYHLGGHDETEFEGKYMLLNSDGYWLKNSDKKLEWGFMFDDKKEISFKHHFPKEWSFIDTSLTSQFETENGFFTSSTIFPVNNKIISSNGSSKAFSQSTKLLNEKEYYWKVLIYIPASLYLAEMNKNYLLMAILLVTIAIVFLILSFLIAKANFLKSDTINKLEKVRRSINYKVRSCFF